jgi:GAF domain-containing protein
VLSLLTHLRTHEQTDLRGALQPAAQVLTAFFRADACDAFVCNPTGEILVALAASHTPLSERQRALGLDQLPLSHGGRVAWVFQQQEGFRDGRVQDDPFELVAIRRDLGVRSTLAVPFALPNEPRGVFAVRSVAPDHFDEPDLELLRFVAYWVALVAQQYTSTGDGRHQPKSNGTI